VEVTCSFEVIQQFEVVSNSQVSLEALLCLTLALETFAIDQFVFKFN
jgi:hypothetical protein